MPADGAERTFCTVAANVVTGIGFALLLVAVSEIAGGIGGWREGLLWGFGGFAAFTLAPGLGLQALELLRSLDLAPDWHVYPMPHAVCPQEIADIAAWFKGRLDALPA